MNRQEIFNQSVKGLASQGFTKSILDDDRDTCAYRGLDGRKCAIGHCFPDSIYAPSMEGRLPHQIEVLKRFFGFKYDTDTDARFLTTLQNAHDDGSSPALMQQRLRAVAKDYNLELPEELK